MFKFGSSLGIRFSDTRSTVIALLFRSANGLIGNRLIGIPVPVGLVYDSDTCITLELGRAETFC